MKTQIQLRRNQRVMRVERIKEIWLVFVDMTPSCLSSFPWMMSLRHLDHFQGLEQIFAWVQHGRLKATVVYPGCVKGQRNIRYGICFRLQPFLMLYFADQTHSGAKSVGAIRPFLLARPQRYKLKNQTIRNELIEFSLIMR